MTERYVVKGKKVVTKTEEVVYHTDNRDPLRYALVGAMSHRVYGIFTRPSHALASQGAIATYVYILDLETGEKVI